MFKMSGQISFESSMKELEEIVKKLEGGEIELNEAMALFEKGVGLTRECGELLNNAKQRVSELIKSAGGENEMEEAEFDKELNNRE